MVSKTQSVISAVLTNRAPVLAAPMPDQTWSEGTAKTYIMPVGTFTDPDANALTYSATLSSGVALPSWLTFNATTRTFSGTAPTGSADYTVRVKAMDAGGLSVFDDVKFITATAVVTTPDLVVSSITAPISVVQGSNLSFSYVVMNQGKGTTSAHNAGINLDAQPTETSYRAFNLVGALAASGTQTLTNSISTVGLSVGTHTLYIKEDFYYNAVTESNEANNVKSVTFTVTAPPMPDLVISSITAPASVVQGSSFAFSYIALNQGKGATSAHYAGINLDGQPSEVSYLCFNAVGALTAAGTQTLTNSISTVGLNVGTHTLYIKEDFYYNAVTESIETNNVKSVTFTVTKPVAINHAPVVAAPMPDQTWSEGTAKTYIMPVGTFTDPDANALTYSATLSSGVALPSWLTFNATTRTFSGTAPTGSADYTVRVKAMDAGGLSVFDDVNVVTASAATAGGFSITLTYTGDAAYATYFAQAKAIWERVITGDLPDFGGVDDVAIAASVNVIDGAGNVLAQAGPTNLRSAPSYLPYKGTMEFDSADMASMLADGSLAGVIEHEMGHVLGFGTIWTEKGLNPASGQYTGAAALAEYRVESSNAAAKYVPLETGGGSGTANAHWSETTFKTELMTGYANAGAMPLSRLTVAAMQDLGYTVNYAAADSYTLTAVALVGISSATITPENLRVV